MNDVLALASILIAVFSVLIAALTWLSTREQARKAREAIALSQQLSQAETVMHFTDRFFDLVKDGEPAIKIVEDPAWAYQFWSLQATEFYFFHHGTLPVFMYTLWMVELSKLYRGINGDEIWAKHAKYLDLYSLNYEAMCKFFDHLHTLSEMESGELIRYEAIATWIKIWIRDNPRKLSD